MAEQAEEIIIDVKVNAESTAKELSEVTALLAQLKVEQRQLTKEIEAGNDADGKKARQLVEVAKEVQSLTAQQKSLTGQLQTTYEANNKLGTSFREMDALARQLENQYKALSKEQRESAEGQALKKALIEQKKALKEFDAELGNHQRNVGNYPQTWLSVIPGMNKVSGVIQSLGADMGTLSTEGVKAFSGIGKSIASFGKMFLTPPVIIIAATLGAIMYAAQKLREAFQRNDEASTKLQAAFAKLQPIGDAIGILFNKLADVIATLVEKIMSAYEWIIKLGNRLGIVSDEFVVATAAASALVRSVDELEEIERRYTVNSAQRSKQVAQLRNEAMSTDDLQARIDKLKEAIELEKQTMQEAVAIAQKRLSNLQQEAAKIGDTSDETQNKIAQAQAELYRAQEAYYSGTIRLLNQLKRAQNEYYEQVADKEEIEAIKQRLLTAKNAIQELTKPAPIEDTEIEDMLRPLTAYEQAVADLMASGMTFNDAQKKIAMETRSAWAGTASSIAGAMSASFGAISDLLSAYSEESEEAAKAAKGFALVGIIASEAESVANGVRAMTAAIAGATNAGAATGPAAVITTPLFITEMVSIVGGMIASTIANIAQAKNILGGAKFATGGIVAGTSYTGDRVPAMVNSGEMILNRQQQSRLFEIANAQSSAAGYEMTRAAMTDALQAMPAPVMVYSEFQQFGKQVTTYKEIASI